MKKFFAILFATILFSSCAKDENPYGVTPDTIDFPEQYKSVPEISISQDGQILLTVLVSPEYYTLPTMDVNAPAFPISLNGGDGHLELTGFFKQHLCGGTKGSPASEYYGISCNAYGFTLRDLDTPDRYETEISLTLRYMDKGQAKVISTRNQRIVRR